MKKLFLGIIVLILIVSGYLLLSQEDSEPTLGAISPSPAAEENNKTYVDLDGDNEEEYIILEMPEEENENYLTSLIAYSQSGEEIASLPSEIRIKVPMTGSVETHSLNTNDAKEYFSFDFVAGPHQSETMFFELNDDLILPVCHENEVTGPYDCLFYSGNTGYLPLKDLDDDGYLELIETVDEYPSSGELTSEEENAIDQAFNEQEVGEFAEKAEIIAKREKGGRGKTVVWTIYSFNGKKFVKQTGDNYENYYDLIGDLIENKMKKSELSEDSLEYIQFVKDFWGHGN